MSELNNLLTRMIEHAQVQGQSATKLRGGLHIYMIVTSSTLKLSLRRENIFPSQKEWDTVLAHLPWPTNTRPNQGPNYTLFASMSIHPKLL